MVEKIEGMTLEEFVRLYDQEGPFELIDGERIPVSPTTLKHGKVTKRLFSALLPFEEVHHMGQVFVETPFVLAYTRKWVKGSRVPDLMFFLADRLAAYETSIQDADDKPVILVPDLVVEIISPTDNYNEVIHKIGLYLQDGVRLVWLVNPKEKTVTVYTAGSNQFTVLTVNDTLDGDDVIPGFSIAVSTLFA